MQSRLLSISSRRAGVVEIPCSAALIIHSKSVRRYRALLLLVVSALSVRDSQEEHATLCGSTSSSCTNISRIAVLLYPYVYCTAVRRYFRTRYYVYRTCTCIEYVYCTAVHVHVKIKLFFTHYVKPPVHVRVHVQVLYKPRISVDATELRVK